MAMEPPKQSHKREVKVSCGFYIYFLKIFCIYLYIYMFTYHIVNILRCKYSITNTNNANMIISSSLAASILSLECLSDHPARFGMERTPVIAGMSDAPNPNSKWELQRHKIPGAMGQLGYIAFFVVLVPIIVFNYLVMFRF